MTSKLTRTQEIKLLKYLNIKVPNYVINLGERRIINEWMEYHREHVKNSDFGLDGFIKYLSKAVSKAVVI